MYQDFQVSTESRTLGFGGLGNFEGRYAIQVETVIVGDYRERLLLTLRSRYTSRPKFARSVSKG